MANKVLSLIYRKLGVTILLLLSVHFSMAQDGSLRAIRLSADSLKNQWECNELWKYKNADSPLFSSLHYNDSHWQSRYTYPTNDTNTVKDWKGVKWFRYSFISDSSLLNQPFCLQIIQNGASEIYLDGTLIAKVGLINKNGLSTFKNSRLKPILFQLKDTGLHVFSVRYVDFTSEEKNKKSYHSGFVMSIGIAAKVLPEYYEFTQGFTKRALFITGAFIALGLVHLLLFLFYRKAVYNFYFSLYNFSIGFISYLTYIRVMSDEPYWVDKSRILMFFAIWLFAISMTGFVNNLFGKTRKRFRATLIIAGIIGVLYFFRGTAASFLLGLFIVYIIFEAFIVIIRAMIKREKSAFIVGGGILIFFLVIVMMIIAATLNGGDINLDTGKILGQSIGVLITIVLISFPMSISAYLAWQFASTNISLKNQLVEVQKLSERSLQQEQEKQQILEHQNERLETEVAQRTLELVNEKQKSDDLLLNILPQEVADELKEKGESKAHYYDEVTVLFTDFVNFTAISEKLGVEALLEELNVNFTAFDRIMEKYGLEKIKTIGDAYLAVSGLPNKNEHHAQDAVQAALDILDFVEKRKATVPYGLDIRIGINSGSLVAGIIGVKKFAYDIWGDTVNTAARMEQSSEAGKINISIHTYELVKESFDCMYRGKINAKGKGAIDMYYVKERK